MLNIQPNMISMFTNECTKVMLLYCWKWICCFIHVFSSCIYTWFSVKKIYKCIYVLYKRITYIRVRRDHNVWRGRIENLNVFMVGDKFDLLGLTPSFSDSRNITLSSLKEFTCCTLKRCFVALKFLVKLFI